jgi:hypothetical protein
LSEGDRADQHSGKRGAACPFVHQFPPGQDRDFARPIEKLIPGSREKLFPTVVAPAPFDIKRDALGPLRIPGRLWQS